MLAQVKDALFPLLERVLTDVINDAMDGCNIADLISTGACFRSIINAMTSLFVATIIYYTLHRDSMENLRHLLDRAVLDQINSNAAKV